MISKNFSGVQTDDRQKMLEKQGRRKICMGTNSPFIFAMYYVKDER